MVLPFDFSAFILYHIYPLVLSVPLNGLNANDAQSMLLVGEDIAQLQCKLMNKMPRESERWLGGEGTLRAIGFGEEGVREYVRREMRAIVKLIANRQIK